MGHVVREKHGAARGRLPATVGIGELEPATCGPRTVPRGRFRAYSGGGRRTAGWMVGRQVGVRQGLFVSQYQCTYRKKNKYGTASNSKIL